jgi:hypothetical protein
MSRIRICSVDGCDGEARARGWCLRHYQRWRRYGDATYEPVRRVRRVVCSIPDCDQPYLALGFCVKHYQRFRRHGSADVVLSAGGGRRPTVWTRERIIEAIQTWVAQHGSVPSSESWIVAGENRPTCNTVRNAFGSWSAGIRAAGFTPRPGGRPKR